MSLDVTKDEYVNEMMGSIVTGLRRLEHQGEDLTDIHKALDQLDDEIWQRIEEIGDDDDFNG